VTANCLGQVTWPDRLGAGAGLRQRNRIPEILAAAAGNKNETLGAGGKKIGEVKINLEPNRRFWPEADFSLADIACAGF